MANSDLMQCQLITDQGILSLPSRSTQAPTFPNVGRHEAQLEVREKSGFVRGLQLGRFMLITYNIASSLLSRTSILVYR
jgi:hypothetical protein